MKFWISTPGFEVDLSDPIQINGFVISARVLILLKMCQWLVVGVMNHRGQLEPEWSAAPAGGGQQSFGDAVYVCTRMLR
jgi:hypothetical protein